MLQLTKELVEREEIIVKKQLNATIAGMLSWGYIISTFVFIVLSSTQNMAELLGFVEGRSINSLTFWGIGLVLLIVSSQFTIQQVFWFM